MTGNAEGRSIELFFIDGNPEGMLTAEVFNWTGHVLLTPRTRISGALARREAKHTGVYLLLGEQDGASRVYVGEAEDISERIRTHDTQKDWWTSAALITTTANALNKAHAKYLEARLVERAREADLFSVDNGNTPPKPSLSEVAQCNMEAFLAQLFMVLPAIRVDAFILRKRSDVERSEAVFSNDAIFEIKSEKLGVHAIASIIDGEFLVLLGSCARKEWVGAHHPTYHALYERLRENGVLELDPSGAFCIFSDNYTFSSVSAAAAVILGRPANGTTEWKVQDTSVTYKEWEAEQLAKSADDVE